MTSDLQTIFISHVSEDETIALALKDFLEGIFLNASVFVSGRDLVGGQVWIEELRKRLATATAILAVISPRSVSSRWVYFEAGAGVCRRCTIPMLVDGMELADVGPPFSLLQLRRIDRGGLETVVRDIAGLCEMRIPSRFPAIEKTLEDISAFLSLRQATDEQDTGAGLTDSRSENEAPDSDLSRSVEEIEDRARSLVIRAIGLQEVPFDVPSEDTLRQMPIDELYNLAAAIGVALPLGLLTLGMVATPAGAPVWEKLNERNRLNTLKAQLDGLEGSLLNRRLRR